MPIWHYNKTKIRQTNTHTGPKEGHTMTTEELKNLIEETLKKSGWEIAQDGEDTAGKAAANQ